MRRIDRVPDHLQREIGLHARADVGLAGMEQRPAAVRRLNTAKVAFGEVPEKIPEIKAADPLTISALPSSAKLIWPCRRKLLTETIATKIFVAEIKIAFRINRK